MKKIFAQMRLLSFAILGLSSLAMAAPNIEGIYNGEIVVFDSPNKIPLQVALTVTGETVVIQTGPQVFEERNIIDGAFLVDDEGGPYGFSVVNYSLDRSELDLRYNRADLTLGQVPASFRLVGNVDKDGAVAGKVLSGLRGPIGTFTLKKTDWPTLRITRKYQGVWAGQGERFPQRYGVDLEFGLGSALSAYINPPNYEFYFTPGKTGYVTWNGQKTHFNRVAIDYLRHKITFSDTDPRDVGEVSNAECVLDPVTGDLVGTLYGVYRGQVASFRLKRFAKQ